MNKKEFIKSVSKYTTGITIVTLGNKNNGYFGCTMNSFTSLSVNPPKILICVDIRNSFIKEFKKNALLNINILSNRQKELSKRFSSDIKYRWNGLKFKLSKNEIPYFENSLIVMENIIEKKIISGDHLIVVCELKKIIYEKQGTPLVYFNSDYLDI